jgi:hypothetical protein
MVGLTILVGVTFVAVGSFVFVTVEISVAWLHAVSRNTMKIDISVFIISFSLLHHLFDAKRIIQRPGGARP